MPTLPAASPRNVQRPRMWPASTSSVRASSKWVKVTIRELNSEVLFPLDRPGRLARDVEHDAPDRTQLGDHARRDLLEQVVWQAGPVGRHCVIARDGADHDHVPVGPLVAL